MKTVRKRRLTTGPILPEEGVCLLPSPLPGTCPGVRCSGGFLAERKLPESPGDCSRSLEDTGTQHCKATGTRAPFATDVSWRIDAHLVRMNTFYP